MSIVYFSRTRIEIRENMRLAAPLIAAQIAAVGMGAIDTLFAGRLGAKSLAAVAVGVNFNIIFFVFAMGVLMACSPIVAQLRGGGRSASEIGAFMRRARQLGFMLGVIWLAVVNIAAAPLLTRLNLQPDTALLAVQFVRVLSGSAFGFSLYFALRFCAEGAGQTRPMFVAGVIGLATNTGLDWLLVFGKFGLPALGVFGCGVATTISSALMAGVLWSFYHRRPQLRVYLARGVARGLESAQGSAAILRLGLPIAAIITAEAGLFVLTAMLMARFGDATVAAYQVAINFASLLFMIPMGVAQGTTVRVGLAVGAGDMATAQFRGTVGMGLGLFNAASNAAIMLLFGRVIANIYTRDAIIAAHAAHFLLLAAVFQFFDGLQVTANGALRGLKDTRLPMAITLVAYWLVGLPVAWWLAFNEGSGAGLGLGPDGLWWGLTAGLGVAALGLSWRFFGKTESGNRNIADNIRTV